MKSQNIRHWFDCHLLWFGIVDVSSSEEAHQNTPSSAAAPTSHMLEPIVESPVKKFAHPWDRWKMHTYTLKTNASIKERDVDEEEGEKEEEKNHIKQVPFNWWDRQKMKVKKNVDAVCEPVLLLLLASTGRMHAQSWC